MVKKIFAAAVAVCLLGAAAGAALAHEHRAVDVYTFNVGFMNEPAFEGLLNGVFLEVTKPAAPSMGAAHGGSHGDGHGGGHGDGGHTALEAGLPVDLNLFTAVDADGGVMVNISAGGWRWAPERVNQANVDGEGHAHIYVDGVKINRVYGQHYYLEGLEPGKRQIRVSLNANAHEDLTYNGAPLEATAAVDIPDAAAMGGHGGHGHGDGAVDGVEAPLGAAVFAAASEDPLGGYNLRVLVENFVFAPESAGGAHVRGEGYVRVSIDGERHARMYGEWLKLPELGAGAHTITAALYSNDHKPYMSGGAPVAAEVSVQAAVADAGPAGGGMSSVGAHGATASPPPAPSGSDAAAAMFVDHHGAAASPVEGLETTLRVEVTHIPTATSRVMDLRALREEPGRYAADFIPTAAGQYTFRFFGDVEGVRVDEIFVSGPGRFADVEPPAAIQFPEPAASGRELEAGLRGALESGRAAQEALETVRTIAIAGAALGLIGVVVGGAACVAINIRDRRLRFGRGARGAERAE